MIFSIWLRTGSNPADINRFQSHTGELYTKLFYATMVYTDGCTMIIYKLCNQKVMKASSVGLNLNNCLKYVFMISN